MKKMLLLIFCYVALTYSQRLTLNFTSYSAGVTIEGQDSWTSVMPTLSKASISNSTPLSYSSYGSGGKYLSVATHSSQLQLSKLFSSSITMASTCTFYYSMVVNINSAGDGSYYSFSLDGEGYIFARVKMKDNNSGQWRIGIEKNTSSPVWGPTDFNYNQTYLIIVRYTKNPGTSPTYDDESYVWVNPPLTGEPNIAAAEASSGNGLQDYSSMSKCTGVVLNIHSGTPEWQLDDIRVGYGTTNSAAFADMNYDNTMPVELASFNAKALKNDVILSWKTATETNNFGFEIERITITGHPEQPRATPLGGAEGRLDQDRLR